MRVSVVIPTYNRCSDLEECIKSLMSMEERPYEIVVVDSGSSDGTQGLKNVYPIKYISIKQNNRETKKNVGILITNSDIVVFLDDDVVLDRYWLKHILKHYHDNRIGGVGGRIVPFGANVKEHRMIKPSVIGKVLKDGVVLGNFDVPSPKPVEVDCLPGVASFRRSLLIKVGGFNENFKGNCYREETDLCLRVKCLGKLIYEPRSIAYHKFRGKTIIDKRWMYDYTRNSTYFYFKNIFPMAKMYVPFFFLKLFIPSRKEMKSFKSRERLCKFSLPFIMIKGAIDGWILFLKTKNNFIKSIINAKKQGSPLS